VSNFAAGSPYQKLLYAAAYAATLEASGYTLDLDYPQPSLPAFMGRPTSTQDIAASGVARTSAGISNYNTASAAGKLIFTAEYIKQLESYGYTLASTYGSVALPNEASDFFDSAGTLLTVDPLHSAAAFAAAEAAVPGVTKADIGGTTVSVADQMLFVATYIEAMLSTDYNTGLFPGDKYRLNSAFTPPLPPDYQTDFLSDPGPMPTGIDYTSAVNSALQAAQKLSASFTAYTPNTPGDDAANLAYVAKFTEKLVSKGYLVSSTYAGPAEPTASDFTKAISTADMASAVAKGSAAAIAAGAPTTYTFPSGVAGWDSAYKTAYESFLDGLPSTDLYTRSVDGSLYAKAVPGVPTAAEVSAAHNTAHESAMTTIDPNPGYPSTANDLAYRAAYDAAYKAKMLALGYTEVLPQPTPGPGVQFFTKSTSATTTDLAAAATAAKTTAEMAAANAGQAAYDAEYKIYYDLAMANITTLFPSQDWLLEGMGFAGAWDATDTSSPIDPENYTHANPWTIYDSLGNAHTLMVYYQPNPHMENVWDYIITCDPTEDARKDTNNMVLMNGATFAGIIQKGKITFTADGPDRHGGEVKDIEAQNLDLSKTTAAFLSSAKTSAANAATAGTINHYRLDGYFTGGSTFSASTGSMVSQPRQYTLEWAGNLGTVPDVSGFTWKDDAGNSGTIPIYDKNYPGPYTFGSGLNVTFDADNATTPMKFSVGDSLIFKANSEAVGWTNLKTNSAGYFDFDVAFVQSATMSPHPPYPAGLPTIIQHIALDMGAKNLKGGEGDWILDEQGTTQYASESLNIFSSQDGYPAGSLQRVSIDKDGVLTGIYTNGRHQPLYQIGLARFLNPWGLAKLGDNVYQETRWSGTATLNPPGYGGTGTIRANFLEQSNTDLADEIVNMIVTQRGFQANSKVVTTTDTMLAEVIEMKR
jgi:flagellar hook protein FlgE